MLDVDDTTLLTYEYEVKKAFSYDPKASGAYIRAEKMSAVFGMSELVSWAIGQHIGIFYISGRPESQRAAMIGNLQKVGYQPPVADHIYLKNADDPPPYLSCGASCTTIQYKSQTRAHIEKMGYIIEADIGDQYSDLKGGYAVHTFKLPNPKRYLP